MVNALAIIPITLAQTQIPVIYVFFFFFKQEIIKSGAELARIELGGKKNTSLLVE